MHEIASVRVHTVCTNAMMMLRLDVRARHHGSDDGG
jgi:hypothetical protein